MREILLIDDDEGFRGMLFKLLSRHGFAVVACANGREGVKLYRKNPEFVVVTDLIMPDQEGIETIIQLKREYPDARIIAMSGGGRATPGIYLDSALRLGASRSFAKPFDNSEFIAAVRELAEEP